MKVDLTVKASKIYQDLSGAIKRTFRKQVSFLEIDIRHPSLRAKKYDESLDIWQARINDSWRFYFVIKKETITILHIQKHPK